MLLLNLFAAMAAAAPKASPPPALVTEFHFEDLRVRADGSLPSGGSWVDEEAPWLTIGQLPSALRDRPSEGRAIVRLSVEASGQFAACDIVEPQDHADIARKACQLLAARKIFPKTYRAPGQSIPRIWTIALVWETITQSAADEREAEMARAPHPPIIMPTGGYNSWPPLYRPEAVVMDRLPDIGPFVPQGAANGRVGVLVKPAKDREEPDCDVRQNSGNTALDEAACNFVHAVRLRYKEPCYDCNDNWWSYPLLIEFNGSKSRVMLPREDADYRSAQPKLSFFRPDLSDVAALSRAPKNQDRVFVSVKVATDGSVTDCRVPRTAGSAEADQAICDLIGHQKFAPAHDVFGEPVAAVLSFPFNLTGL